MPAHKASLDLSERHKARVAAETADARETLAALWRTVDVADLDRSYARWENEAIRILTRSQTRMVEESSDYVAFFLASERQGAPDLKRLPAIKWAGNSRSGRPLRDTFRPALWTVKSRLGEGVVPARALRSGGLRALKVVSSEIPATARDAALGAMSEGDGIAGYRRVLSAKPCPVCLGLADGRVQAIDVVFPAHTDCKCSVEPVLSGLPDRHPRPSGQIVFEAMTVAAQIATFARAGGERVVDKIIEGEIALDSFVQTIEGEGAVVLTPLNKLGLTAREMREKENRDG